jgi:hypothetical protein
MRFRSPVFAMIDGANQTPMRRRMLKLSSRRRHRLFFRGSGEGDGGALT